MGSKLQDSGYHKGHLLGRIVGIDICGGGEEEEGWGPSPNLCCCHKGSANPDVLSGSEGAGHLHSPFSQALAVDCLGKWVMNLDKQLSSASAVPKEGEQMLLSIWGKEIVQCCPRDLGGTAHHP